MCTEIPPLVADVTAPCDVLSVQQLTEWRAQPNALLVDVRSVTAHRQHNLNALSVPFNETWHGFVPDALTSHKHTPVCLVCDRGRTSELAARCLLTAGFSQVSHLAGGMVEWRLVHEKTHIPQPSVHNACQNDT